MSKRSLSRGIGLLVATAAIWLPANLRAQDDVPVPGGPASVRRLLGLDSHRPEASFFVDLHEILVFATSTRIPWKDVERRRSLVEFSEDVAAWRAEFGTPATFSTAPGDDWKRTRRAFQWLGFRVKGDAGAFTIDRRDDARTVRREACLEALGTPVNGMIARLKSGERVTVTAADFPAPLPFGLAAWRETLDMPALSAEAVFLELVKNVRASRLLVALHAIDPETREELRTGFRDGKGRAVAWRMLYERALDTFGRFPEALMLRDGRFVLPGGQDAEPVWADVVGVSPSDRSSFLNALFETDSGKAAYVAAVFHQLPDAVARELLVGRTGGGAKAIQRFRRLYRSIDPGGINYALVLRDPYDLAHLARFLRLSDDGDLLLPAASFEESSFPRGEAELAAAVGASRKASPEEVLRRLFRSDSSAAAIRFPAQRRFLFVSSLVERRPDLADPGLILLLASGLDRFWPAYSVFDDLPFDARLARRYLFTLDRLDRRSVSRHSEVTAGLFQGSIELLAQIARAETIPIGEIRDLLRSLLDLPLFASDEVSPAEGEPELYRWFSARLMASLRTAEAKSIEGRRAERAVREQEYQAAVAARNEPADPVPALVSVEVPEESASPDELLTQAMVGRPSSAAFEWRGGRYRFDAPSDEAARRRAFREKQRLAWLRDLDAMNEKRAALLAAAARGDLAASKSAAAELGQELRLGLATRSKADHDPDERIQKELERARDAIQDFSRIGKPKQLRRVAEEIGRIDAVIAERHLEAYLGHAYAAAADPEDLYYQDPDFVRRHVFYPPLAGKTVGSAFSKTSLVEEAHGGGGGSRVSGSLFGLADALGLLHADQVPRKPGAAIGSEEIRSGIVAPVRRMSVALLDDDALRFVAASCRATDEFAAALGPLAPRERVRAWTDLARDLVPRSRLSAVSEIDPGSTLGSVSQELSPSELYLIGKRLAAGRAPAGTPPLPAAIEARDAFERLRRRHGDAGARERIAQFGPRAVFYAGRFGLSDLDLPPYERLAVYRTPQILSDRLYDLKIAVACRVFEAGLPAAVMPVVLSGALDEMLSTLKMAFAYDWASTVRAAHGFRREDVDRLLDGALMTGRLTRDHAADESSDAP